MPALTRTTERGRQARERGEAAILRAAEELVAEGTPYGELGIETIAKRAGFSRATFYAYFTDKRALALTLGSRVADVLESALEPWLSGATMDTRATISTAYGVFTEHRGTMRMLIEASTYDEDVAGLWRGLHDRFATRAAGRLAAARPELSADVVHARAYVLVWATEHAIAEQLQQERSPEDAVIDALVLVWDALLA